MAKVQPLGRRVAAEPMETDNKTASGLYLAGDKKDTHTAKVVAVGPKVAALKVGDVIVHQSYSTYDVDGQEYVIVSEKDVLAVIK